MRDCCSGGWRRTPAQRMRVWASGKPTFVYRSKGSFLLYQGKTSLLLAYIEILWHFIYKSCFVLLIRDRRFCFVLSPSRFRVVTNHRRWGLRYTYVLRHLPERLPQKWEKGLYNFKYGYLFLQKCIDLLQEAFIHPPEPCDARFNMDACTYLTTFGLLNKNTHPCHYKAWKSQDNFLYTSDWIHLKEEVKKKAAL